jgi:DMSO/TMAO reductase YedYZ heme-binding membrane subunit
MRKIAQYWRLALLPFVFVSLWVGHICVTQFEGTRRVIVVATVLMIVLVAVLGLLRQSRRTGVAVRPPRSRDVLARTSDHRPSSPDQSRPTTIHQEADRLLGELSTSRDG